MGAPIKKYAQIRVRITREIVQACNEADDWMNAHGGDVNAWLAAHRDHPHVDVVYQLASDGAADGWAWGDVLLAVRSIGKSLRTWRPDAAAVEVVRAQGAAVLPARAGVYSVDPNDPSEAERGKKAAKRRAEKRRRDRRKLGLK